MPINAQRFMENFTRIGTIGRQPDGGITRLAFSEPYFEAARELIRILSQETGCQVYRDFTGSIHAVRPGSCGDLPQIVMGSHLDTVPDGGMYDGLTGIMAGVELMKALEEDGVQLRHPLHLIAFNAEEAGPLGGTFSSRTMMGAVSPDSQAAKDALAEAEAKLCDLPKAEPGLDRIKCFLELHIEQGGILDEEQIQVGAVTGIFGIRRYHIVLTGESNHAGTTPMSHRLDPMVNAARLITMIYQRASAFGKELVATVGKVDVSPNLESVIPGQVELVLEMRSLSDDAMDQLLSDVTAFAETFSRPDPNGDNWPVTPCTIELKVEKPPLMLDQQMAELVAESCSKLELSCIPIPSGAGHDAKSFAAADVPTGMIFIPSIGGRSHCPQELTRPEQLEHGTKILYEMIRSLDEQD